MKYWLLESSNCKYARKAPFSAFFVDKFRLIKANNGDKLIELILVFKDSLSQNHSKIGEYMKEL